ncbi:hypothetical protein [Sediminispirochaeta bajacaliforniensis]|uniref:hypothetical protein n=1 Tax=Sediminispirochaeta bajacaliforniensis TaxID=148 RepID=UPI0012B54435|nr:hypothetical protein [Sediminispirochaeta bajacaliforniensis]
MDNRLPGMQGRGENNLREEKMKKMVMAVLFFLLVGTLLSSDELSGKTLYRIEHMEVLRDGRLYGFLVGKYTFNDDGTYKLEKIINFDEKPKSYTVVQYSLSEKGFYTELNDEENAVLIKMDNNAYLLSQPGGDIEFAIYDDLSWLVSEDIARTIVLDNPERPTYEGH